MGENDVESQFSLKPPVMSLNDNMNFFGKKLQVQTENVDSRDPYILTQVFLHGRVIHSARCEYTAEIFHLDDVAKIHDLMRKQHMEVIEKINKQQEKYHASVSKICRTQNCPDTECSTSGTSR